MQLDSTFFKAEIDGAVAHLIMNRPDKANSMTPDFWDDLPRLTRELDKNPEVRAMVISGAGKHFSAGMDLAGFDMILELLDAEPARASYALHKLVLRLQETMTALEDAQFPVIAAIQGACVGGDVVGLAQPFLAAANESAESAVQKARKLVRELEIAMFCVGARSVSELQKVPVQRRDRER